MPGRVQILIISPTRELASQIYEEGQMLCKFHVGFKLMCVFGGTNMKKVHATRGIVRVCARKGVMTSSSWMRPQEEFSSCMCMWCVDEAILPHPMR